MGDARLRKPHLTLVSGCAPPRPGENIRVTRRDSDPGGPDGLREDLVLSVRRFGVVPVVIAEGTVDLRTGPQLAHVITVAVARQPADVVIDLTGVRFLSVTGLHVLLDARRAAGNRTRLRVLAAGEPLRMITLTEADQVLAVYSALPDGTGH